MKRHFISLLLVCTLVLTVSLTSNAAAFSNFGLSNNYKTYGSYVTKNGGTAYENVFYLTVTSMKVSSTAHFRSVNVNDTSIMADGINVTGGGTGVTKYKYYNKTAPANQQYKLQAKLTVGSSDTVAGRWTP